MNNKSVISYNLPAPDLYEDFQPGSEYESEFEFDARNSTMRMFECYVCGQTFNNSHEVKLHHETAHKSKRPLNFDDISFFGAN